MVLLLINAVFLIAGMFVDPNSAIIVLVPLLYGIGVSKGIDPIQLGIIITVNLAIGMLTPPFGLNLFVGSQVLKVSYTDTVKASIPFIIIMFLCLILVSFIPSISLWLPRLFGGI
ncbi:MAG: TRAP transporter large permease subunit [Clostridiales bacterium]|nr:TRAP transporter large permease subunit [Clostridiales bacterium]